MGTIGGINNNRGASSYFNKNGGQMGSSGGNTGLPALNSTKGPTGSGVTVSQTQGLGSYGSGGFNKPLGINNVNSGPSFPSYKYGGLGGLGGIGGASGIGGMAGSDPYHPNY